MSVPARVGRIRARGEAGNGFMSSLWFQQGHAFKMPMSFQRETMESM